MRWLVLGCVIACGTDPVLPVVEQRPLGMNDVSILVPLPTDLHAPVVATLDNGGAPLVDPDWFYGLVILRRDIAPKTNEAFYESEFQLVALRVDLCDRSTVGACPADVDGRLRLVFQPIHLNAAGAPTALDIAVHAFYPIPATELAGVITELRTLARIQDAPVDAPLEVSPAAQAGNADYLARLRTLVVRYARRDTLVRLTVAGQEANAGAFEWLFRGLDFVGPAGTPLLIPGILAEQQRTLVAGGDIIYNTDPVVDAPVGFATAINGADFAAASDDQRVAAVVALTQAQNPTLHDAVDLQCIACHVSTFLTKHRAETLGLDPATIAGHFESPYNTHVESIEDQDERVIRGFGWAATFPAISQRVANDTAEVLTEIDVRFAP